MRSLIGAALLGVMIGAPVYSIFYDPTLGSSFFLGLAGGLFTSVVLSRMYGPNE